MHAAPSTMAKAAFFAFNGGCANKRQGHDESSRPGERLKDEEDNL